MNVDAIVEVAIAIIFVWIGISLATIQIQEWISQIANKRAKDLEQTIHTMLDNSRLQDEFYNHPIIRGLAAKKGKLPSYIPAQQFALTLFDMAMNAGTESSLIQSGLASIRNELEKAANLPKKQAALDAVQELADLARQAATTDVGRSVANAGYDALLGKLEKLSKQYGSQIPTIAMVLAEAKNRKGEINTLLKDNQGAKMVDPALIQLRRGFAELAAISPELSKTLQALVLNVENYATQGETQLGLARQNVEQWFNDSMDRLNGVFKRYAQFWAFVIGLYLALTLNLDSINLALYLWRDPTVRQVLVANAQQLQLPKEQLATDPEGAMQEIRRQFVGLNLPVGWVINESKGRFDAWQDSNCQLFPGRNQAFGIPILGTNKCIAPPQTNNQTNIALKFFGILFTAAAAAQGAPFWFDLLKKLINLRATGANPAEKGDGK